jgi:hypothetical protein
MTVADAFVARRPKQIFEKHEQGRLVARTRV